MRFSGRSSEFAAMALRAHYTGEAFWRTRARIESHPNPRQAAIRRNPLTMMKPDAPGSTSGCGLQAEPADGEVQIVAVAAGGDAETLIPRVDIRQRDEPGALLGQSPIRGHGCCRSIA